LVHTLLIDAQLGGEQEGEQQLVLLKQGSEGEEVHINMDTQE